MNWQLDINTEATPPSGEVVHKNRACIPIVQGKASIAVDTGLVGLEGEPLTRPKDMPFVLAMEQGGKSFIVVLEGKQYRCEIEGFLAEALDACMKVA